MVEVHDLHVWTVTSGFPALSAHVLVAPDADCHAARRRLEPLLDERFGLTHTTLQVDHVERAAPRRSSSARPSRGRAACAVRLRGARSEGKSAVVTGASSGIGAATARALARRARVSSAAPAASTASPIPSRRVRARRHRPGQLRAFVGRAVKELGGIDILVNGAGLALGRDPFDDSTEEDERIVLETNVNGLIRMTRLSLPHLRDGGHIVNLGSIAGRQAYERGSLYITSKFAVRGFTYALREDLLGRPIRITTIDPGLVQTDFSVVRFRGDEETARKVYEGVEAMKPDDIAECVLFAVTRPPNVNVDELVVKALAQSSGGRILRDES